MTSKIVAITRKPKDAKIEPTKKLTDQSIFIVSFVVPRTGIEPVTHGFSIRCSTN